MELEELGWADPFKSAFEALQDETLSPARVVAAQREHYRLLTDTGGIDAAVSGRLRHQAAAHEAVLPVVGDWVAARLAPGSSHATIAVVLPRRGTLARKRPDRASQPQVLAANLDVVFVVSSLNHDFSPRRIERALATIWEAGAQPVVLLTKLDACGDPEPLLDAARAVALGVPVHALSVHAGEGLQPLHAYATPGRTLALIGSSGVGKSTLVNWFLGEARVETSAVREGDDKGRHTTTARELFVLPQAALLIDTPGMRELGLWEAENGLEATFEDIEALTARCRFGDCAHRSEPGCAVQAALADGSLDPARHAAHEKLRRELAYHERRRDQQARAEHQRKLRQLFRQHKRAKRS